MDELVGGWQIAGDGSIGSQDFAIGSGNFGPTNPIKYYKHGAKFTDCRSGTCVPAYLWFNGYIPPKSISSSGCPGMTAKVLSGLPTDYKPYETPIDNDCTTSNYATNNVQVALLNGSNPTVGYSPGPYNTNTFSHTVLNGPKNYTIDLSVFKVFPITEKSNLRFNVDAFNALNMQGFANPNTTDGTEQYVPQQSTSANTPRQVQFTLRLTF
jgi:hypothetical protein